MNRTARSLVVDAPPAREMLGGVEGCLTLLLVVGARAANEGARRVWLLLGG